MLCVPIFLDILSLDAGAGADSDVKVHVGTPVDKCIANNQERLARHEEAYTPDLLENLIFRYEEPSTHSRWDKPLFTVPWTDPEPPVGDIWTALTGIASPETTTTTPASGSTAPPPSTDTTGTDTASVATGTAHSTGTGTAPGARIKIKPHAATLQPSATTPTALYDLEKRTSAVISAIRAFTQSNPSASAVLAAQTTAGITIPIPDTAAPIFIPAHIAFHGSSDDLAGPGAVLALPRLQRLKRQWIGLNRAYIGGNYAAGMGGWWVEGGSGGGCVCEVFE